jgi:Glu-tRNA(Gln) amidotransferase subunit E-like FAD-binding protein
MQIRRALDGSGKGVVSANTGQGSVWGDVSDEVEKYKAGKKQVYGFLVGQVMKAMKGKANPAVVNELLKKKLGG